jgi:hypothetical protein
MEIPEAFLKLSNMFHQDRDLIFGSVEEAISASIYDLTLEEKLIAKKYLDELLSGNYNDEQLVSIWNKTPGGADSAFREAMRATRHIF